MRRQSVAQTHRRGAGLAAGRRAPRHRSRRSSRHLFDRWAEVRARLASARNLALFLDFDGTLAPLRRRPEEVWLDARTRQALARLAENPRITIWIISGRRLADLRRRTRLPGIRHLGLHGWERADGKKRFATPEALRLARKVAVRSLEPIKGVWVEDKGVSFAVHYRGAAVNGARRARRLLQEVLKPYHHQLRALEGNKVLEVLPAEIPGKGEATRAILKELKAATLPVYLGDDSTDESAFAVLSRGLTVRVGPARRTLARFRLRNPQEVWGFLERLEEEIH